MYIWIEPYSLWENDAFKALQGNFQSRISGLLLRSITPSSTANEGLIRWNEMDITRFCREKEELIASFWQPSELQYAMEHGVVLMVSHLCTSLCINELKSCVNPWNFFSKNAVVKSSKFICKSFYHPFQKHLPSWN